MRRGDSTSAHPVQFFGVSLFLSAVPVLKDITFTLNKGEVLALLGPSGCGKTSLLRLIAGLEKPESGEIRIFGRDASFLKPGERGVSFAFQDYSLFPDKSIRGNLEFPLRIKKVSTSGRTRRLDELYRFLGSFFRRRQGERPKTLSMGEKQRVSVGRALACTRPILLLDEPLSEVDRISKASFIHTFRKLAQEQSSGVVYVTNSQEEAMAAADRILILDTGELVAAGVPMDLYRDPQCLRAALALGSPPINTVAVSGRDGASVFEGRIFLESYPSGEPDVCILAARPEALIRDPEGPLEGRVVLVEKLSPERGFVHLSWPEAWTAIVADGNFPQLGDTFCFRIRKGMFFSSEDGRRLSAVQS